MFLWIIKNMLEQCSVVIDETYYSVCFRAVLSFFCTLFISLLLGSSLIIRFRNLHIFQIVRSNGPKSHALKQGTPAMGGLIILISIFIAVIVWSDLSNFYVWYILLMLITYGTLGFIDDLLKIKKNSASGLSILCKYLWQSLIALLLIFVMLIFNQDPLVVQLIVVPFLVNCTPQLGIVYVIILAYFVIVGTSNAVNLSDGLDGLAIVSIILVTSGLAVVAYAESSEYLSNCLHIPYIYSARELIIVCASIVGASLGFLWFNIYPAQIFMGDVGSLPLGGTLGIMAVFLRQEFFLLIMGGVFVIETISVILQVGCYKLFKQRVFKMAPIHHHFELQGCPESRIVVRFWIISCVLVFFGLIILIMRW